MATYKVTAPPERAGWAKVAGVAFAGGQAVVDDSTDAGARALAYFRRHGYQVEPVKKAPTRQPAPLEEALEGQGGE